MSRLTATLLALSLTASVAAQTHRVQHYEGVTRAVGVYEWTGDMLKPDASRLIPVSLFIYSHFEDAGTYLSNPMPMAIDNGVRYQVQVSGVNKGFFDILYGRHLERVAGIDTHYDEGWFGYGKYSLPKPPKPPAKVTIADDDDKSKPKLNGDKPDPERPTFQKEDVSAGKTKQPKDVASVTPVSSTPADDDDRPILHKRDTPAPPSQTTAAVTQDNKGVLEDPDRPIIHRGRPASSTTGVDVEHLRGLPKDLHQAVAVSDPVDRPEHNFAHTFIGDEQAKITASMEKMARDVLANPSLAAQMANPTATPNNSLLKLATLAAEQQPKPTTPAAKPSTARRTTTHTKTPPPPPAPVALEDVQLRAFDLAYNSVPVFVLTAHTTGEGANLKYVTVVAQADSFGTLQPVMRSLTDATHLDRTPWMRLIDVVDPDASNRACLLFELRGNGFRQFALYRIYAGQPTQVFLTGSTM